MNKRVAVVGGGASGLVAAIVAAKKGASVTIYERCDRVAKKILATGNGRCNITNINANENNYHGENPKFILNAINSFWVEDTLSFFKALGIITKAENNGKVYPYSLQASAVTDCLRFEAEALNIKVVCDFEVQKLEKKGTELVGYSKDGRSFVADSCILATGGKASEKLGSNGSGYPIAESLGHKISKLTPSLVQVKTDNTYTRALQGLKVNATVSYYKDKKMIKSSFGEVLFTEYGLSGPPVFDISREAGRNEGGEIRLDIMSEYTHEEIRGLLKERQTGKKSLENYLTGMLPKKLAQVMLKSCDIAPLSRSSDSLTDKEIDRIIKKIKAWSFDVKGTMSWNNAQVTAGGVLTKDINPKTMESKLVEGVYFSGELMDVDGDCGGYNLQWAWTSGYIAGTNAAE